MTDPIAEALASLLVAYDEHTGKCECIDLDWFMAQPAWQEVVVAIWETHPLHNDRGAPRLNPDNPADVARLARAIEKSRQTGAWSPYAIARAYTEDGAEPEPLWGSDGPAVGQVITIAGTSMQTRWNGHSWEILEDGA